VNYWEAFELSYQLYDDGFAGRGYSTEAVQLLVDYLFGAKKHHRIHLVIVPENAASRVSPRSAASSSRERSAERSSTRGATRMFSCTRCSVPTPGRGTRPGLVADRRPRRRAWERAQAARIALRRLME
jgi:Acetyltransferase (GNAT) domain